MLCTRMGPEEEDIFDTVHRRIGDKLGGGSSSTNPYLSFEREGENITLFGYFPCCINFKVA
jgi:hypothetical protein